MNVSRFWSKVEKTDGCWNWGGTINERGYGKYFTGGRSYKAHRLAYEMLVSPIPAGLVIDHLCRNRRCVNPTHLEPVTIAENNRRGKPAPKPRCARGHEFTGVAYGWRYCRECKAASSRRAHIARQARLSGEAVAAQSSAPVSADPRSASTALDSPGPAS